MPIFIDRLPYVGELPASFDLVGRQPYAGLGYAPFDEPAAELCAQLAATHDIVFYTDHWNMRLAGLFPKEGGHTAYFAFWETSGSLILNQLAFEYLLADAAEREFEQLQGPLHFSSFFRYRLRLGAVPSWRQFDCEPVNPPYYPGLLAQLGFQPALTFESHCLPAVAVPLVYERQAAAASAAGPPLTPFEFIGLTPEIWQKFEDEIFALLHQLADEDPAYRPVGQEPFQLLYNAAYAAGLCPWSSVLVRHPPSGQLVALSLCQPNYHELGRAVSAHPVFARDYPRLTHPTLLIKRLGVHPDFWGQGLHWQLAAYVMRDFRAHYENAIFCLLRTDDHVLRFLSSLPTEAAHYALFERAV